MMVTSIFFFSPQSFQKASFSGLLMSGLCVNSLPNDKILDMTKVKAFADNEINEVQVMISVFDRVENIVEQGENAG